MPAKKLTIKCPSVETDDPILTGILTDCTVETRCVIYRTFLEPGPVVDTPRGRDPRREEIPVIREGGTCCCCFCCAAGMRLSWKLRSSPECRRGNDRSSHALAGVEKQKPGHKKHFLSCPQLICRSGGTERLVFSNSNMTLGALH